MARVQETINSIKWDSTTGKSISQKDQDLVDTT